MKLKPMVLVSVYIPTKNRLDLLMRAIQSVKNQTYPHIELIVVDDGSDDGTREYLELQMQAGNLIAIFNEANLGACASRNKAIAAASGTFVTGLDDDDYFLAPERIEWFIDAWNTHAGNIAGIFDCVKTLVPEATIDRHCTSHANYQQLRCINLVGSQVFAPKNHYVDVGLFDPAMPAWQDWDLWLRMAERFGPFVNMQRFSYMVDEVHDADRLTTRSQKRIREAKSRLLTKLQPVSAREKSSLIVALFRYPQVIPTWAETLYLFRTFRLFAAGRSAKKLLGWK